MGTLISILIVVIILGALLGGKGLGSVVRRGCGFILILVVGAVVIILIGISYDQNSRDAEEAASSEDVFLKLDENQFKAKEPCPIYSQPDIDSDTLDFLDSDDEIWVENPDRYRYFYTLVEKNQEVGYVRKECFEK